jgi:hypothetical protein
VSRKFKSFGSPITPGEEVIEFEIYGYTFRCKPGIQGRKLLEFILETESETTGASAAAMIQFLDSSIVDEQRDTFQAVTESDETIIPMDTLSDITAWLIELYSGNSQEKQPEQSPTGPTITTS